MAGHVNVGTSPQAARIPLEEDNGSTTISLRLHNHLLATLNAKARSMSLTRSSLIILGIHQVLDPDSSLSRGR